MMKLCQVLKAIFCILCLGYDETAFIDPTA